jgi:Ser/Thr protein kinase RdoA (MazF antagonist)
MGDEQVVARLGGSDPPIEAAVMAAARRHVPVPEVLLVMPSDADGRQRPAMILEHGKGTPLSRVLGADQFSDAVLRELGAEVGRVAAAIAGGAFDRPGFFADEHLTVAAERPWSEQLPEVAASCMARTRSSRLDPATQAAWVELCSDRAAALTDIDDHARLVDADLNPKNVLVTGPAALGEWTHYLTGTSATPGVRTPTQRT